jgi:PEP-CTERM motif
MKTRVTSALTSVGTLLLLSAGLLVAMKSAQAVQVSASSNPVAPTNHMALPGPAGLFDPGAPDFGSLGLAAPGAGTNSVTVPFAYPAGAPNAANAVQMYGDTIAAITNLGSGSFQVEVTLTNFWMDQGTALASNEYVYLNVWETFTNLGLPSSLIWSTSGSISVSGLWAAGPGQSVAIEPIAIVYDPSFSTWGSASPFFGATGTGPGGGPLLGSQSVTSLTPYVSGGQLTVGMQAILLLNDPAGVGGASMNLPSSLHLSMTLEPVEVPEPGTLLLAAIGIVSAPWWRRRC